MAESKAVKKPAPPKAQEKRIVTPDDFKRVQKFLTTEILVERDLELRLLSLGALSGVNVHMIGAPGIAKSLALREFAKCVTGAEYFEKVVHGLMPADAIIGGYDMPKFAKTGDFERKVAGYAPACHIVFIDELPRANGPTHDSLLPMMNSEERAAEHNGGMFKTSIMVFVSASNTWFDADNEQHQALSDRVTVMLMVEDVRQDSSFKEVFRRHHARRGRERGEVQMNRETISLEQLEAAQTEVARVTLSDPFLRDAAKLRKDVKKEGLTVSTRRWMELGRLCRANAWMAAREETIPEDLVVVEHGLWRDKDDIPVAHQAVLQFHSPYEQAATQHRQEAKKALTAVEQIRSQVEGTPPNKEFEPDVLTKAISASRQLDEVKARVDKVLAEAEKDKSDAAALRELSNELLAVQKWFKDNGLPTSYSGD